MRAYFDFMHSHGAMFVRCFLALTLLVDALFIYAAVFNRDLPPRLAERFFGALSGQKVRPVPSSGPVAWWQWVAFAFVSAMPILAWVCFEKFVTKSMN